MEGTTNGFRIYSPDGADWYWTTPANVNPDWEDIWGINGANWILYNNITGYGADTVGFFNLAEAGLGLPGYFDDTVSTITIGPISSWYDGRTICIDSSFFGGNGIWSWATSWGALKYPAWDGPHCFTIESNTLTFGGYIEYLDPVPPSTNPVALNGAIIEAWDNDLAPFPDQLLATDTIENGYYYLGPIDNGSDIIGGQDVYFRIVPDNDLCFVTFSESPSDFYYFQTPEMPDMTPGEYFFDTTVDLTHSAPFFILDVIVGTTETWLQLRPGHSIPKVHVVLSADNQLSSYNGQYIHIESSINDLKGWPDSFDEDIIAHEYAHIIGEAYNFFDASLGGAHSWDDQYTPAKAADEGFANFFANLSSSSPISYNYYNNFSHFGWTNSESGEYGQDNVSLPTSSANNYGELCEGAVAGILWDIYDEVPVADDWSSFGVWHQQPYYPDPDGIGDTLTNGPDYILGSLIDKTVDGRHPDNIEEFWQAWFQDPSMGHYYAMRDIWYEHGIDKGCCMGTTGNVDNDPTDYCDVSDLTYLVDYELLGGPEPACLEEANVDASSNVQPDIADITFLVDFLFAGGAAPPTCP